jgi:TolB protein
LRSNTSAAERARARVAGLAAALCVTAGFVLFGPPAASQDDVRIGIRTNRARQIRLLLEPAKAEGDRDARTLAATAQDVLYNDLDNSGMFAIARSWVKQETPFDIVAVVEPKLSVRGSRIRVVAEVKDFPARRLIGRSEHDGVTGELRLLVHRAADDVVYQITGERGVAETRIAFVAGGDRQKDLYVVDYDGHGARKLTHGGTALSPSWSTDGGLLAFAWLGKKGWSIYSLPSAGGKPAMVRSGGGLNSAPAYAPDGRTLAFSSSFEGNSELYVQAAGGGTPRRLTKNRAIDTAPSWSPNGQKIAFTSDRDGSVQVYIMDADGANVRRLVYGFAYTDSPDWSPKGDRLAFVVRSGGGFDIYVVDAQGADPRQVVSGGSNLSPRWSPDGRHLVFSSSRGGGRGLYVTDADGVRIRKLDVPGPEAKTPAWSPRPNRPAAALGSLQEKTRTERGSE